MSEPKVIIAGWCTVDPKRGDEAVESFKDVVLQGAAQKTSMLPPIPLHSQPMRFRQAQS
jgi:hypothetical protein